MKRILFLLCITFQISAIPEIQYYNAPKTNNKQQNHHLSKRFKALENRVNYLLQNKNSITDHDKSELNKGFNRFYEAAESENNLNLHKRAMNLQNRAVKLYKKFKSYKKN